jgi:hypothetical protein
MKHLHAVVIGGTGMLRRASAAIASESLAFTAVARTSASLEALARDVGNLSKRRDFFLTLNWDEQDQFVFQLSQHFMQAPPPSLVLAWLHNVWLGPRIASAIPSLGSACKFFQVLGSAGRGPMSEATDLRNQIEPRSDLAYSQIILGFKREASSSRWLTNDEISDGALAAISANQPSYVIGAVTPWNERPPDAA